ncbi:sporulation protein YabP [Scopulibacillus darangshiensis]|uniref:Sporulation protein YabP n=1 Tax=Scopulibacillus darangshiensis TaxID=442528 RepID=A0A4V2SL89_9BACL|nr:sporulation protein YabP [Scopulibacillus darangshiensis]TCP22536.1 sporulation protein YabP [Scopulibacillus darangshiensis]
MDQYYTSNNVNRDKQVPNHDIIMKSRKKIEITGVKHVESFDHEEFLLETVMGFLAIKGSHLKMQNLNVEQGIVIIEGKISDISYLDDQYGDQAKGFFSKLFK